MAAVTEGIVAYVYQQIHDIDNDYFDNGNINSTYSLSSNRDVINSEITLSNNAMKDVNGSMLYTSKDPLIKAILKNGYSPICT